ncbi:MAG: Hsp20/alpha crystallin family protein [Pseudomonadota bacterium]|nr:Hsp20/alpha crystallin family protein [Pseudomonadota bacterium]
MADLTVRRGQGGGGLTTTADVDPFRMVRESMRRMQDLFREPSFEMDPLAFLESGRMAQFIPDFEVRETQDGLVFMADLPGVKENDVEVTVIGNRLRINGKREFEQENRGDTWYTAERAYGSFNRTFILPEGADTNNVEAHLDNGVLNIRIPKRAESQPRRIALGGQQQRALEGQYSQGPFQQSQPQGQQAGAPSGAQASGERAYGEQEAQRTTGNVPGKVPEKV